MPLANAALGHGYRFWGVVEGGEFCKHLLVDSVIIYSSLQGYKIFR